ncbi:DUF6455 family protein [Aestuariivita boseongensis]|uniref:DUF6455 family protein n=1 Tax=Aestuariivita boseongensis TaxID=1470562 RepID=UPI003CCB76FB
MSLGLFEEKLRKFEDRMSLWRKMRRVTGADQLDSASFGERQEEIRESLITCQECCATSACRLWLQSARLTSQPPDFCENRDRFTCD